MPRKKICSHVSVNLIIIKPSISFPSGFSNARFSTRKAFEIKTSWKEKNQSRTEVVSVFFGDHLGQRSWGLAVGMRI